MSKKFFRWLRGELNGFYLNAFTTAFNECFYETEVFLRDFGRMVMKKYADLEEGEVQIDSDSLHGIALTAGIFPPYISQESLNSSIRFTVSHKVNGVERSERGLYNTTGDTFTFKHTESDDYDTDINTLASSTEKSSLVEENCPVIGYFQEGDIIIKDDGTLDMSKLLLEPPEGKAYYPYYGDKYLFLAESYPVIAKVSDSLLLDLLQLSQKMKREGASVASLDSLCKLLCPSFVFILSLDWTQTANRCIMTYGIDEDYEYADKLAHVEMLRLIINSRFSQIIMREVSITVNRDAEGNVISVDTVND